MTHHSTPDHLDLDAISPVRDTDLYPDPTAALLKPSARHSTELAIQLAADREPTADDALVEAKFHRFEQAFDSDKKA